MADIDGKQHVKTNDAGDVQVQVVDSTTPSQGQTVNTDGQAHVLAYGNDGTSNVVLPIDGTSGGVKVDIVDATGIQVDVDIDQFEDGDTQTAGDKGTVAMGTDGTNYQFMSVDSTGKPQVDIAEVSVTALPVSADGNANTALNPIFVNDVGGTTGDDIHQYATSAAVANGATHTTSYTVTVGKTLKLTQCMAACSGRAKVEVQVNSVTKSVRFIDVAAPDAVIDFPTPIEVPAGQTVDVIVTNRSILAQDLYATINGSEV